MKAFYRQLTSLIMMNLIFLIVIVLFQNCSANYFSNPYTLQDLFIKELKIRSLLEEAKADLDSKHIET